MPPSRAGCLCRMSQAELQCLQQPIIQSQSPKLSAWDTGITQHSPSLVHETSFWYLLAYISHLQPALTHWFAAGIEQHLLHLATLVSSLIALSISNSDTDCHWWCSLFIVFIYVTCGVVQYTFSLHTLLHFNLVWQKPHFKLIILNGH